MNGVGSTRATARKHKRDLFTRLYFAVVLLCHFYGGSKLAALLECGILQILNKNTHQRHVAYQIHFWISQGPIVRSILRGSSNLIMGCKVGGIASDKATWDQLLLLAIILSGGLRFEDGGLNIIKLIHSPSTFCHPSVPIKQVVRTQAYWGIVPVGGPPLKNWSC